MHGASQWTSVGTLSAMQLPMLSLCHLVLLLMLAERLGIAKEGCQCLHVLYWLLTAAAACACCVVAVTCKPGVVLSPFQHTRLSVRSCM